MPCTFFPHLITGWYLSALDNVFLAIYFMEIVLKLYALRSHFFKTGWNIMGIVLNIVLFFPSYCLEQSKTKQKWQSWISFSYMMYWKMTYLFSFWHQWFRRDQVLCIKQPKGSTFLFTRHVREKNTYHVNHSENKNTISLWFLFWHPDLLIVLFTMVDFLLPLIVQNVGSFDVAAIFRLLRMFRAIRALRALRVLRTIRSVSHN